MAASPPNQDIFDVRKIRRLVELMKEYDLCTMELHQGDVRIRLRRGGQPSATAAEGVTLLPAAGAAGNTAAARQSPAAPAETAAESEHVLVIKSPMVGTYYSAADPESPPFVKVGDHVGPETTVCIVEAMKVFNQIPADVSGKIIAVLAENGQPVEFGQPLFKVDTRG